MFILFLVYQHGETGKCPFENGHLPVSQMANCPFGEMGLGRFRGHFKRTQKRAPKRPKSRFQERAPSRFGTHS